MIICFLMAVGLLIGCSSTPKVPKGEFLIQGELTNVPDSVVIRLLKDDGKLLITIHQDTVINGKFSFHDTISDKVPEKLLLSSNSKGFPGMWLDVWVQSGKYIHVMGGDSLLPLWKVDSDIPQQQAYNDFMALCPLERKRAMQLCAMEYDLLRDREVRGLDWEKIDSLRTLCNPMDSIVNMAELNYMKEAPITSVWLDKYHYFCKLLQYDQTFGHQDLIHSLYARMSEADKATEVGQLITDYLNLPESVNIGDEMVDGDLYDLDGNVRHLAEFKDKYILLDFWSQGCSPCIQSLPELEEITEQYKDKMEVVSISQDSKDTWKKFIAEKQLKGNQWNELRKGNTGLGAVYQVKGIPHYVLISPEGKVQRIWAGYGKGSLKAKMKELIK